jgi:hypothetical protein
VAPLRRVARASRVVTVDRTERAGSGPAYA